MNTEVTLAQQSQGGDQVERLLRGMSFPQNRTTGRSSGNPQRASSSVRPSSGDLEKRTTSTEFGAKVTERAFALR